MKTFIIALIGFSIVYYVSLPAQELSVNDDVYVFRNDVRPEYSKNLSQSEFAEIQNSDDITLIDVRLVEDFAEDPILIPGAEHKDPEMIASWANLIPKDKKVVLYCVKGAWVSHKAATYLASKGYDVSTLNGGIRDWKEINN